MATRKIPNTDKLPAISVRQPYASMIMWTIKDLEFRSWNSKHRGPMLIHASNSLPSDHASVVEYQLGCSQTNLNLFVKGCYLGIVDIQDVIVYLEEDKELDLKREFAFLIGNVAPFEEVIPGKGAANLFYPTDEDWKKLKPAVEKALATLKKMNEESAEV
ncbi:MAG: ASCH domain-containing protein [Ignavibacteria bacterium]|nr:ASCH domain-containing protein [Ignavibacteria bacterium]